jgi:hypothetical protein
LIIIHIIVARDQAAFCCYVVSDSEDDATLPSTSLALKPASGGQGIGTKQCAVLLDGETEHFAKNVTQSRKGKEQAILDSDDENVDESPRTIMDLDDSSFYIYAITKSPITVYQNKSSLPQERYRKYQLRMMS